MLTPGLLGGFILSGWSLFPVPRAGWAWPRLATLLAEREGRDEAGDCSRGCLVAGRADTPAPEVVLTPLTGPVIADGCGGGGGGRDGGGGGGRDGGAGGDCGDSGVGTEDCEGGGGGGDGDGGAGGGDCGGGGDGDGDVGGGGEDGGGDGGGGGDGDGTEDIVAGGVGEGLVTEIFQLEKYGEGSYLDWDFLVALKTLWELKTILKTWSFVHC